MPAPCDHCSEIGLLPFKLRAHLCSAHGHSAVRVWGFCSPECRAVWGATPTSEPLFRVATQSESDAFDAAEIAFAEALYAFRIWGFAAHVHPGSVVEPDASPFPTLLVGEWLYAAPNGWRGIVAGERIELPAPWMALPPRGSTEHFVFPWQRDLTVHVVHGDPAGPDGLFEATRIRAADGGEIALLHGELAHPRADFADGAELNAWWGDPEAEPHAERYKPPAPARETMTIEPYEVGELDDLLGAGELVPV